MPTGFFGKLPAAGDFVARGLPPGARAPLDRWLTQMLGEAAARPEAWPDAGLLAVMRAGQGTLLVAALPSRDAAGRAFPLAAVAAADGAGVAEAEAWAEAVRGPLGAARSGSLDPAALAAALSPVAPAPGTPALAPPLLWVPGHAPGPPEAVLGRLFPVSSG